MQNRTCQLTVICPYMQTSKTLICAWKGEFSVFQSKLANLWQMTVVFIGAFSHTKKQQYLSQIRVFFDNIFLTEIKTRKSFKKGSENSQKPFSKTHKYLTNSVFDRFATKPFTNNHTISFFKFEANFNLRPFFVRLNAPLAAIYWKRGTAVGVNFGTWGGII